MKKLLTHLGLGRDTRRTRRAGRPANTLRVHRLEARDLMSVVGGGEANIPTDPILDPNTDPAPISIVQELPLNSRPGAPATLFLDFNGHFQAQRFAHVQMPITGLSVGGYRNVLTPAFDRDGDPLTFSANEQQAIRFIWASVAEDYAPFNINVTTVDPDPGVLHPERKYQRVIISGDRSFRGDDGGFAVYGAYAKAGQPNVAYVFNRASDGAQQPVRFLAEAAAHEAGHAFGLYHYGTGTGNDLRAPIMRSNGAADADRGTWAAGTRYYVPGDMAVIAGSRNGFGYRPDDHGNTSARASALLTTNLPGLHGFGVIGKTTDVDRFRFETGGGTVTVRVELPGEKIETHTHAAIQVIGNLDARVRLFDAAGRRVASADDPTDLDADLVNLQLPAGTYFVEVGSHGRYGDVGRYHLSVVETSGPQIVNFERVTLSPTLAGLWVTFDEPINPLTFTTQDVRLNGGRPGAGVAGVTPDAGDPRRFLVTWSAAGTATRPSVTVGPSITDRFGNPMPRSQTSVWWDGQFERETALSGPSLAGDRADGWLDPLAWGY